MTAPINAFEDQGGIESSEKVVDEMTALQGVIFDRTITQTGLHFYQAFAHLWLSESISQQYALSIRETPTARQGSIVWIEEGSRLLHRISISQRDKDLGELAKSSIQAIRGKLGESSTNIDQYLNEEK